MLKVRKSLFAVSVIAAAVYATPVWAGTSRDSAGAGLSGPNPNDGFANAAVTISLSGSTATRNWLLSGTATELTSGTSIYLNNGNPNGVPAGFGATPIWSNQAPTGYTNPAGVLQLAPSNFTAAQTTSSQAAIRFEWHEQGSVEGIVDMVNDQIGYIPVGTPITPDTIRNPNGGNPIWVNGNNAGVTYNKFTTVGAGAAARIDGSTAYSYQFNGVGAVALPASGLQGSAPGVSNHMLAKSTYNTYDPQVFDIGTGKNLQGGQDRVQLAISDVNANEGFQLGRGPGYGLGNSATGLSTTAVGQLPSAGFTKAGARYQFLPQSTLNMGIDKIDPQTGVAYNAGPWNTAGLGNLQNTIFANTAMLLCANPGTGLTKVTKTDTQWLQTAGRFQNGADFNVTARDINSGTRVSFANNTGVDPSLAVGENDEGNGYSSLSGYDATAQSTINANGAMRFSNKSSGGSQLRPTVQNNRMALGTLSVADGKGSSVTGASSPVRALDYAADNVNFVRCSATSITGGGGINNPDANYALWTNQTMVTVKAPNANYNFGYTNGVNPVADAAAVAAWSAQQDIAVTTLATSAADARYAGPGIKGDNWNSQQFVPGAPGANTWNQNGALVSGSGNDVADFRNMVTTAVATFPASTTANAADGLVGNGYVLSQMMALSKSYDGDVPVGNAGYSAQLRSDFINTPSIASGYNVGDPSIQTKGNLATYGNGVSGADNFSGGKINITDNLGADGLAHHGGNWLFGNFRQDGIRDFDAIKNALTPLRALTATGNNGVFGLLGTNAAVINTGYAPIDNMNGTAPSATRGDLIVLGDFNGDGKFDGKDLFLMAHGAALSDAAGNYAAGKLSSMDAVRTGVLRKNDALDYFDGALGNAGTDLTIRTSARVQLSAATVPFGATALGNDLAHPITLVPLVYPQLYTWDVNGANAFNKRDVNHDGKIDLNDAFIVDKFNGQDYTNQTQVLAATINADGTINHTSGVNDQVTFNLVDAKLVDPSPTNGFSTTIGQPDMNQLNTSPKGLAGVFNHTWTNTTKAGTLSIVATPAAGSTFTVPSNSTTLTIAAGSFTAAGAVDVFTDNSGTATNGNHMSVNVQSGGTLNVARNINLISLTVNGTVAANSLAVGGAGSTANIELGTVDASGNTVIPGTLTLGPTGLIDLQDRMLLIHYTQSSTNPSLRDGPGDTIKATLVSGRHAVPGGVFDGPWTGTAGITSSRAASDFSAAHIATGSPNTEFYALGYGDTGKQTLQDGTITNKMLINDAGPSFYDPAANGGRGAGIGSTVFVRYTRVGDATMDGIVGNNDVTVLGLNFDPTYLPAVSGPKQWYDGDFNYNGVVDNNDVTILGLQFDPTNTSAVLFASLASQYGSSFAASFTQGVDMGRPTASVVPEPGTLTFLAVGALTLIRRRRQA